MGFVYTGTILAAHSNLIVTTLNIRLGILGKNILFYNIYFHRLLLSFSFSFLFIHIHNIKIIMNFSFEMNRISQDWK